MYRLTIRNDLGRVDEWAETVARSNAAFRDGNDEIALVAADHGLDGPRLLPFICECSLEGCATVIKLTLSEYRRVRSNPRWFAHAPGHEAEIDGLVRLVEANERYLLVEKVGAAGDLVARLAEDASAD